MDHLRDLEIFAQVVATGGMSTAARNLGLSPAVVSKRIRRLEERLGARLLQRTTRQLALTEIGQGFYERVVLILASIENAEMWVAHGSATVRGLLRISAPTSFGRMHIAPHLKGILDLYPALTVDLVLSDDFVDIIRDGFDLAIRIADLENSSLIARRLAPNHRILCASPAYLARYGTPECIDDLSRHALLSHTAAEWQLEGPEGSRHVRVDSRLKTNSSEVVREAVIAGIGIALRSTWDVGPEVKSGSLVQILPEYTGSKRVIIQAVYPSRRHLEQKVRAFIDYFQALYGDTPYWDRGLHVLSSKQGDLSRV
ncbi:LysR family transcriptional regulator [Microvirga sp. M2]|uniref:LysR family transcriptional regulator n=1 Tax=Microvirga sp. M2 TaxID=3073270 RepID=UPI0039C4DE3F